LDNHLGTADIVMASLSTKPKPIDLPNDPRFEHRYAKVNGVQYHYLFAEPKDVKVRATVVLVSPSRKINSKNFNSSISVLLFFVALCSTARVVKIF
jgi:hypothetical protein